MTDQEHNYKRYQKHVNIAFLVWLSIVSINTLLGTICHWATRHRIEWDESRIEALEREAWPGTMTTNTKGACNR